MKNLFFGLLLLGGLNLYAGDKVEVGVKGMVCSFCTNGIEKTFKAREEVKNVKVDMDSKKVSLEFKDGKTMTEKQVSELITSSGFTVASFKKDSK